MKVNFVCSKNKIYIHMYKKNIGKFFPLVLVKMEDC